MYNSVEDIDKPKEESKGVVKKMEELKGFSYFSYLVKKARLNDFFGNADGKTFFVTPNEFLFNKGEDHFVKMSSDDCRKFLLNHVVDQVITPDNFPENHYFSIGAKSGKDLSIHNLLINEKVRILTPTNPTIIGSNVVYVVNNLL